MYFLCTHLPTFRTLLTRRICLTIQPSFGDHFLYSHDLTGQSRGDIFKEKLYATVVTLRALRDKKIRQIQQMLSILGVNIRTASQSEEVLDEPMTEEELKEDVPQSKPYEEQAPPAEEPVAVVQTTRNVPAQEKKKMLSLEERMKEFREMMLERGVGIQ